MRTPTTPAGTAMYDEMPSVDALVVAWVNPGQDPEWHRRAQDEVRAAMPLVARALDRLVRERQT